MATELIKDAKEMFLADVAEHRMEILREDGLYRHIRFKRPSTSLCHFDLITWPGRLVVCGDMSDAYVFTRIPDMFQFFRPSRYEHGIDPQYWAEKLPDYGKSVKVHSEEVTRQRIQEHLDGAVAERDALQRELDEEYEADLADWWADRERDDHDPPAREQDPKELIAARELVDRARALIADHEDYGLGLHFAEGARELLRGLEQIGLMSDTWEWDLTDWDFHYLRACHAIVWGIQQYERHKVMATDRTAMW